MESELSGIFRVKLVTKNIERGFPGTQFMHMRVKKYKAIWTKTEDLENIKLSALPVYNYRYIKTKVKAYDDKFYTNFCGLNV